jgi:hypothetical protein
VEGREGGGEEEETAHEVVGDAEDVNDEEDNVLQRALALSLSEQTEALIKRRQVRTSRLPSPTMRKCLTPPTRTCKLRQRRIQERPIPTTKRQTLRCLHCLPLIHVLILSESEQRLIPNRAAQQNTSPTLTHLSATSSHRALPPDSVHCMTAGVMETNRFAGSTLHETGSAAEGNFASISGGIAASFVPANQSCYLLHASYTPWRKQKMQWPV